MKHQRFLSLALAATMCVGLATPALAAEEQKPERGVFQYSTMITPQYEDAQSFSSDGLAAVKKGGKWGYIDTTGKTVIPFQYDIAFAFSEGLAVVGTLFATDTVEHYDEETDEVTGTTDYHYYKAGFVDKQGKYTPFEAPEYMWDPVTGEEMADPVTMLMDSSDNAPQPMDHIFYNGYIALGGVDGPDYFLYDTAGKLVMEKNGESLVYPYGEVQVTEGTVCVGDVILYGGSGYYYNLNTGKTLEVKPPKGWDGVYVHPMNQGMAIAEVYCYDTDDNKFGFINSKGQWVIQPQFDAYYFSGVYTNYRLFGDTGLAMVKKNGKYGAIDKTGKTVIPFKYDELWPVNDGLMVYRENGKYGYLNADSSVAIKPQFVKASGFYRGLAAVYDGTRAYLIDKTGKQIAGSDQLDASAYFFENAAGNQIVYTPDKIVVIQENGKYGYGKTDYLKPLPQKSEMSSWAYQEVTAAIEENLVPDYLQNLYLNNINRNEFCDLVMQALTEIEGKDVEALVKSETGKDLSAFAMLYPFVDSTNQNVIAAYALGIVGGRGNGIFDPYATINREEAAAFLMRSAKVLGMDTGIVSDAKFKDGGKISVWAKDAVNFVRQINVMNGTGNNNFSPRGKYTRQQSYITIYRLFQSVKTA